MRSRSMNWFSPRPSAYSASLRYLLSFLPVLSVLVLTSACSRAPEAPQAELDRKFEQMMNGATLAGRSSSLSSDRISSEERYFIDKVSKMSGDTWLFEARFRVGEREWPMSIPVQIKFAGDTPVITVTDLAIPGMAAYSARVVLHNGQYAGTWNGKNYGGQMFGKIVPRGEKLP